MDYLRKKNYEVVSASAAAVENIAKPVEAFAVEGLVDAATASSVAAVRMQQEIKYCRAPDGVRLAYDDKRETPRRWLPE